VFQVYQNYQSLLDYSERDALTGLFNRKTFDEQFAAQRPARPWQQQAPERGARISAEVSPTSEPVQNGWRWWTSTTSSMVNDRFGHLYGDEVLILVANILRSSFRSHDRIFRFGGEEFVVLLRSTTLSKAHKVFNRFREAVQEYHFPQVGHVTVSLGFVGTSRGLARGNPGPGRPGALLTPRNMVATRCASTTTWWPLGCCRPSRSATTTWVNFSEACVEQVRG
jgi:GGDEF domain-containing protein